MSGYTINDGQISYSSGSKYYECPRAYKYRYIDKVQRIHAPDSTDALILGSTFHLGMEKDYDAAVKFYLESFNIIDDIQINELMKIEHWLTRGHDLLLELDILHKEYEMQTKDYKGTIDLITDNNDGTVSIWDYKYCSVNGIDRYLRSEQLHLYKHFLEATTDYKVKELKYVFFPKSYIRQKNEESLIDFRNRMMSEVTDMKYRIATVEFLPDMLAMFGNKVKELATDTKFIRKNGEHCKNCPYRIICNGKDDYNMLPSIERRDISEVTRKKIWIYGPPFSGKTTFLDGAPNPLNLNTDGNIQFVTMPYVSIKDEITTEGRLTKRKYAWEVLKDTVLELEKHDNDFKTVIVDLLEDTREMCRLKMYADLGIQHESDSGYGKGWDIIKTEYLSLINRIFNLPYDNIVVLSHEDVSKDITKKNGQNITRIAPNIQAAIANKVAGMVDIVARIIVDDDGTRTLNFKSNEVIFGGGRLKGIKNNVIPLKWDDLMKVYAGVEVDAPKKTARGGRKVKPDKVEEVKEPDKVEEVEVIEEVKVETPKEDKPKSSGRKSRKDKAKEEFEKDYPEPTIDGKTLDEAVAEEKAEQTTKEEVKEEPKQEETKEETKTTEEPKRRRRRRS